MLGKPSNHKNIIFPSEHRMRIYCFTTFEFKTYRKFFDKPQKNFTKTFFRFTTWKDSSRQNFVHFIQALENQSADR